MIFGDVLGGSFPSYVGNIDSQISFNAKISFYSRYHSTQISKLAGFYRKLLWGPQTNLKGLQFRY